MRRINFIPLSWGCILQTSASDQPFPTPNKNSFSLRSAIRILHEEQLQTCLSKITSKDYKTQDQIHPLKLNPYQFNFAEFGSYNQLKLQRSSSMLGLRHLPQGSTNNSSLFKALSLVQCIKKNNTSLGINLTSP